MHTEMVLCYATLDQSSCVLNLVALCLPARRKWVESDGIDVLHLLLHLLEHCQESQNVHAGFF